MTAILALALALGPADDLDERVASVLAKPEEERWIAVPWEPNLMRARAESQRRGKPIFLWIMDGNVLGCT